MALTIIQKALKAQRAAIKSIDGRNATLTRGGITVKAVVTIGETRAEEIVDNQTVTTIRVRDFLIDVNEYDFGSGPVNPIAGDIVAISGDTWQVLPTSSEPEYRRHDRDGDTWRVHTKEAG